MVTRHSGEMVEMDKVPTQRGEIAEMGDNTAGEMAGMGANILHDSTLMYRNRVFFQYRAGAPFWPTASRWELTVPCASSQV